MMSAKLLLTYYIVNHKKRLAKVNGQSKYVYNIF